MLQDIDAVRYKLARHLPRVARYVEGGGGLIMVGGPTAFVGGNYAGTAIERVLPVSLSADAKPFDTVRFTPKYTAAGRTAAVTAALRQLFGEVIPEMPGVNFVGQPRAGSVVILEHPGHRVGGTPMPVLALGEVGDGRSIALAVDGTHRLSFGRKAASAAGRGYGALWDGLLGWLMRNPKYEAARISLVDECIAGRPSRLNIIARPGATGPLKLELSPLGANQKPKLVRVIETAEAAQKVDIGALSEGGYTVRASWGPAPATRFDFACEKGGAAWQDSRPDPARLRSVSQLTGGESVAPGGLNDLPEPKVTRTFAQRAAKALLPPWVWTLLAALALGAHWTLRRRAGLS